MEPSTENTSEHSQTPAAKRRRIALACTACRLRKSRCDGVRPLCSSCVSLGFDCQYEPGDSAANIIVRKEYITDLDARVAKIEHVLTRLDYVVEGHLSACAGDTQYRSSNPFPPTVSIKDHAKDNLSHATGLEEPQDEDATANGMAMTFIEEQTSAFFGSSSNVDFTRLLLRVLNHIRNSSMRRQGGTGLTSRSHCLDEGNMAKASRSYANPVAASPGASPREMTTLPSSAEMDRMLNIYFDTAGCVFPFIHEESMRKTYQSCKENGWARVRRTFLGTLNVIFATVSSLDREVTPSARERQERANTFLKKATDLCGELSKQVISLEIVQYLVLLVIHYQGAQRSVQAWNVLGLLVRSALALGLHSPRTRAGFDEIQAEYSRRTWIVIYCMDKVLSVAFGRPAIVPDEYMVDRMPNPEASLPSPRSGIDVGISGEFLAVSFQLYQIMSGSLKQQYSGNIDSFELEPDDALSLQASGQFRKQLRAWAASLPAHLQLCETKAKMLRENSPANRLRAILTLRYHNINILIHRPFLGSTIRYLFSGDHKSIETTSYIVQLSLGEAHECVRSAQSTIELVHSIITADQSGNNNLGVGYYTLYYVFTAALVVLGRILWSQHAHNAKDETALEICKSLIDQVQTIFQRLDHDNSLIFSCSRYINNILELCTAEDTAIGLPDDPPSLLNSPRFNHQPTSASAPNPLETMMHLGLGDLEMFHQYSSEIYDPALFEGFDQPPGEATIERKVEWETSPQI